jgi:Ca2+-binding EF-hand superfamily protein
MMSEIDFADNKKINYTEFLVATLDVKAFLDDTKLRALFMTFDTDNSGTITRENIVSAMQKVGHEIT